jgi:hypothetical protein
LNGGVRRRAAIVSPPSSTDQKSASGYVSGTSVRVEQMP